MDLQYQFELKLRDFEHRKLQQSYGSMQNAVLRMQLKCARFNEIKQQLADIYSALVKNVQLELQNLKKELLQMIDYEREQMWKVLHQQIPIEYKNIEIINDQLLQEKQQLQLRVEQLSHQLTESEKNEVYLMMLNTKYIKENEKLQSQMRRDVRQLSVTDQNFYPNKTGFISKFLSKHS